MEIKNEASENEHLYYVWVTDAEKGSRVLFL
jgi:hypothetical protein